MFSLIKYSLQVSLLQDRLQTAGGVMQPANAEWLVSHSMWSDVITIKSWATSEQTPIGQRFSGKQLNFSLKGRPSRREYFFAFIFPRSRWDQRLCGS